MEAGEKLGYSVTILLAFFVYKETVESQIAPWESYNDTPKIVKYFTCITIGKETVYTNFEVTGLV